MLLREAFADDDISHPVPGRHLLFHSSKDPNFKGFDDDHPRVTWFVASHHRSTGGADAASEVHAMHRTGEREGITGHAMHAYHLKPGTRLASERHVHESLAALHGGKPEDYDNGATYEHLDPEVTGDHEGTHALVKHMADRGYHGVVHQDYSHVDNQRDRPSVALFRPSQHTQHVASTTDPAVLRRLQNRDKS